jgi:hypothetical protein
MLTRQQAVAVQVGAQAGWIDPVTLNQTQKARASYLSGTQLHIFG